MHRYGWLTRDRVAVLAALLLPLAVCALLALFRDSFQNTDAALVLVLVVVAVAANGNRPAGVLAALSAAVWFDFFLTAPYGRFTIDRRLDVETTVLLLAVGVAVTELAAWGRRKAAEASGQAGYLAGIRAAIEVAATGGRARCSSLTWPISSLDCWALLRFGSNTVLPGWANPPGYVTTARWSGGGRSGTLRSAAYRLRSTSSCSW